ncbi:MAG TPA: hypothetical protein VFE13_12745 [Caulobacteraceae bacterium]|nr:hypothetical protein [Caulobacteraceae bacterium]
MIFRRLLFMLAGAMALAVSAGVFVVALAYALFALVEPYVGRAGAAGIVAGATAVFIGLVGLLLVNAAKPPKRKPGEAQSVVDRVMDFVRNKPVTALGGAVVAGILAIRNPSYLGAVVRAFLEGREPPRRGRR